MSRQWMIPVVHRLSVVAGVLCVLFAPGPAAAALAAPGVSANGCTGSATASDVNGLAIDTVTAPGAAGASPANPFVVDYDGVIAYRGRTDSVITDNRWRLRVNGLPVRSGGSANTGRTQDTSGTAVVNEYLPVRVTGLFYVSGDVTGTGGSCQGGLWVKLAGNPAGTVPFWVGVGVVGIGLVGLLFRPAVVRGAVSGLVLGFGLILLAVVVGAARFTSIGPFVAILGLATAAGAAIGTVRRVRRRTPPAPLVDTQRG